ncbi:DUF3592 domain-containing protein [Rubrivirga marina]|uniref:DUF3592 domain-containing protein n=1 Tax=Rubrivirga marina TaxID=1196024 RepID=A0A271IYV5_9BACT|nr:DUF3592 domain-containing protein [Rubrivirga marina]PAP75689.1 hypothetical protein BSZ37_04180 [Rubrivirga marina]
MASAPPPHPSAIALIGLGAVTLLIGAAGLWAAASLAVSGDASTAWVEVKGEVVESGVDTRRSVHASDLRDPYGPPTYEHRPVVRYTYAVDGRTYTADRVHFGEKNAADGDRGRDRAQAEADRYPTGTPVTVYVDPADPTDAVLEPGRQSTPWMIGVGGIAFLGGIALVGLGIRARRVGPP